MRVFFALFIIIPILEMWLLIEVGGQIGALLTIFLVFLTAAIGLSLLRQQGVATLLKLNQKIEHGQLPATEILEGVALAVGGALLLTPGFITDAVGFLCLLPTTRQQVIAFLLKRGVMASMTKPHSSAGASGFYREPEKDTKKSTNILDGEFHRED